MHSHKGKVLLGSQIQGASVVSCVSVVSAADRAQNSNRVIQLRVVPVTAAGADAIKF